MTRFPAFWANMQAALKERLKGAAQKFSGCRIAVAVVSPLPMALKTYAVIAAEPPGDKLQIAGMSYTCYNQCSL